MKRILAILMAVVLASLCVPSLAQTIIAGTNAEFPPFEYFEDDGSIAGFDVELLEAVLKSQGMDFTISSMEFDSLPAALHTGLIEVAAAAMTISEEKGKSVLFSDPYFNASQKLIVAKDSPIKSAADLTDSMKVGVQLGTTGDIFATEELPVIVERYNKALDGVMDLKNGRIQAVLVDAAPAKYFVEAVEGLVILEEDLSEEKYGFAVKLDNTELMDKLNAGLKAVMEDGTYDALIKKYFSEDE